MKLENKKALGLRHIKTGKMLNCLISGSEDSYYGPNYKLTLPNKYSDLVSDNEQTWLIEATNEFEKQRVEWVRHNSTEYYNSSYETPGNSFEAEELEVVEVEIKVNTKSANLSIPTPYELFKYLYEEKDPRHWEQIKERIEQGEEVDYGTWHLYEYVEKKEKENRRKNKK